jgi:prophage antirepressor-like protein
MDNGLIPFISEDFGEIRTIVKDGNPLFCGQDVCRALGIVNSRDALASLDEDERDVVINDTFGGPQAMVFVSESGLYSLILRSRKPEAKAFKRWITREVIPSVRRTGAYITGMSDEAVLRQLEGASFARMLTSETSFLRLPEAPPREYPFCPESLSEEDHERLQELVKAQRLEIMELRLRLVKSGDDPLLDLLGGYIPDLGEKDWFSAARTNYEERCFWLYSELRWIVREMMGLRRNGRGDKPGWKRQLRLARAAEFYSGKPAEVYLQWCRADFDSGRVDRKWLPLDEPLPEMYDPLKPRRFYGGL